MLMTVEKKIDQSTRGMLEVLAIWLSLVGSCISIGLLVYKGGALNQVVVSTERRVSALENVGSSSLRTHESMDDVRANDLEKRVVRLEDAISGMVAIREDIREIKTRLQILTTQSSGFQYGQPGQMIITPNSTKQTP